MRQCITRLRVRRGDGELAFVAARVLIGEIFDVFCIEQHTLNDAEQLLTGIGQAEQPLAFTDK